MKNTVLAIMLLTAAVFGFEVTRNGNGLAEIVIPKNVDNTPISIAARELQYWIREISGAELPVSSEVYDMPRHIYLDCSPEIQAKFPEDSAQLGETDGYAVRLEGNDLYVFANTQKGVLNGIYQLLFRNTDIIWARPNHETGTFFTRNPNLDFQVTSWIDIPKFSFRGWQTRFGTTWDEYFWAVRNRANWTNWSWQKGGQSTYGMIREGHYGHNLMMYIPPQKYYKTHPEFYAELDGKRPDYDFVCNQHPQLCFSNREMIETFKREFDELAKSWRWTSIMGIYPEDNYLVCECENCRADIELPDGRILKYGDPAFQSTRYFLFFNELAEHVKQKYPDKKLSTHAYFFTEIPPELPIPDNVLIRLAPIYKNVKFPYNSVENRESQDKLEAWLPKTNNIILYDYFGLTRKFPRPADVSAAADYRYVYEHGIHMTHSEIMSDNPDRTDWEADMGMEVWDCNSLYFWVIAQLTWDPYQDVEALRDEYLKRVFGPAAQDVKDYLTLTEKAWRASPEKSGWATNGDGSWAQLLSMGLDKPCAEALKRAGEKNLSRQSREMLRRLEHSFTHNDTFRNIQLTPRLLAKFKANPGAYANLVVNPGFEVEKDQAPANGVDWVGTPLEGWSFWKNYTKGEYGFRDGEGVDGSRAAYISDTGHAYFLQKLRVYAGQTYVVRCKARVTTPGDQVQMSVHWHNHRAMWTGQASDHDCVEKSPELNKWLEFEDVVIVPDGAYELVLQLGSRGNSGTIYFDDVEIYRIEE